MGAPTPDFTPSRRLTAQEAAQLADAVLARASAALRMGPPPVRPRLAPAPGAIVRKPPQAIRAARPLFTMGRFTECLVIGCSALVCVGGWLVQQCM